MNEISFSSNNLQAVKIDPASRAAVLNHFSKKKIDQAFKVIQQLTGYQKTPLLDLKDLAAQIGVAHVYVKDESKRFGLNAFKGLGTAYAILKLFAAQLGNNDLLFDFEKLKRKVAQKNYRLIAATDGNHGMGVAWMAKMLNIPCTIKMPAGTTEYRAARIAKLGADVAITQKNYDDLVDACQKYTADHPTCFLIQDTNLKNYDQIPLNIMQGYSVIMEEISQEIALSKISHVFLQAGVGSFAGSISGYLDENGFSPQVYTVEPQNAACYYASFAADSFQIVKGKMKTIMAGLACGRPNPVAFDILTKFAKGGFSVADQVTIDGMKIAAKPFGQDKSFISGESGAVGLGLIYNLATKKSLLNLKEKIGFGPNTEILLISTEGNTDPFRYKKLVN